MINTGRFQAAPTAVADGQVAEIAVNPLGHLLSAQGYEADPGLVEIVPIASNGVAAVELVAAVAGQRVWPATLAVSNGSATRRTLRLLRGGTAILQLPVPADGGLILDLRGAVRTGVGEALAFDLLDAGVADVTVSGAAVRR